MSEDSCMKRREYYSIMTSAKSKSIVTDLFEFFENSNNYSDRMIDKMNEVIKTFSKTNDIKDVEFYQHYFFGSKGIITIGSQQWKKIVFSSNIIFNSFLSKFLKEYTMDIYGSKIYQFNNNDARVYRNKVSNFFNKVNDVIVPFNYGKIEEFVHDLLKESLDNNYSGKCLVWRVFEISFLHSIFREIEEKRGVMNADKIKEYSEELRVADVIDTNTEDESELIDLLLGSPIVKKALSKFNKSDRNEIVDEIIKVSSIWAKSRK